MGACISNQENAAGMRNVREAHPHSHHPRHHRHHRRRSSRHLIVLEGLSTGVIRENYKFGKELGRGEFGVTYLVTRVESGERFACKTISKSRLRTAVDVEDVRREVEIMRRVPCHPNIVEYKEAYEDRDAVYLVMELCQGGELFDRITARGRYTERAAAKVAKTILTVVQVCHENGVIHRDLKPENFLYANNDEDSSLKAIDFGLSIFFEDQDQRFGEIVGSPYYMAPEVLKRNYGAEVDVWSAGVILYILICGVPPFWATTEEGIAHAIVRGVIDFRRDPWPKVSPEAKDLVRRMLDPQPDSRLTLRQVIEHPWLKNATKAPDVPLGSNVMSRIKQFTLMNKFKRRVLRVVADNLPEDQVEAIKSLFRMMDTDSSGTLSFNELKAGLVMLGYPLPDPDVQAILDAADSDGNGVLDCEEFLTMSIHIRRLGNDEHLISAFEYFDKDQSGYIEFNELREALFENEVDPRNDQVIQDIVLDIDLDNDGRISYDEFKAAMNTGMDWKMASRQYSKAMLNALSFKMFNGKSPKLQAN